MKLNGPSETTKGLPDLPNALLVWILGCTFDDQMYSDEHEMEYNDETLKLLMSTANRWKVVIQEDEF